MAENKATVVASRSIRCIYKDTKNTTCLLITECVYVLVIRNHFYDCFERNYKRDSTLH